MSRADPLEPLDAEREQRDSRQQRMRRIARISLSWFVGFMMISAVTRYMVRYVP